jgi:hypothetical protein
MAASVPGMGGRTLLSGNSITPFDAPEPGTFSVFGVAVGLLALRKLSVR